MNLFALDADPAVAASYHCDKHVQKMDVEAAQVLSDVVRHLGADDDRLYALSHPHHPCTRWAGRSLGNFTWTMELGQAILAERSVRGIKIPERLEEALLTAWDYRHLVPEGELQTFCRGSKSLPFDRDRVRGYRRYYRAQKAGFARWDRGRPAPDWWHTVDVLRPGEEAPDPSVRGVARELWTMLWELLPETHSSGVQMPATLTLDRIYAGHWQRSRGAWSWSLSSADHGASWVGQIGSQWPAGQVVRWWKRGQLEWYWDGCGSLALGPAAGALPG